MARTDRLLRGVLMLIGAVVVVLGLNIGLGGIRTLGWQGGATTFLAVTDPTLYAVRDNHVRFIGGVWLGAGLVILAGGIWLEQLRPVLIAICAMVVVGGLARFSAPAPAILAEATIAPSLLLELLGFPLLALWIARAGRK
jgi:uncharacterized protein YjeT (DUF2065 family)